MTLTQDTLLKKIADREGIDVTMVRNIFKSAEDIIFDCLSSTTPSEPIRIKCLKGVQIERTYVEEKKYSKGMFQNIDCPEHVKTNAKLSDYYNGQINRTLFDRETENGGCYVQR